MTQPRRSLSDPQRATIAWRRFRRLMIGMGIAALAAVIIAIVYLQQQGGPLPVHMLIATIAGVGVTVLLAGALMGLVFVSAGSGHDEDAGDSKGDRH